MSKKGISLHHLLCNVYLGIFSMFQQLQAYKSVVRTICNVRISLDVKPHWHREFHHYVSDPLKFVTWLSSGNIYPQCSAPGSVPSRRTRMTRFLMAARSSSTFPTIVAIHILYKYFWSQSKSITYKNKLINSLVQ